MSARRKAAKGVRMQPRVQNPCLFLVFGLEGHGGTAGDDLLEMPSTPTMGQKSLKCFKEKCFMPVAFF